MSKKTEKFIVIEENGKYLCGYKNREGGTLAFKADYSEDVSRALSTPYKFIENNLEQFEMVEKLAKALGNRLVLVEATYTITDLDGKSVEVREPQIEFNIEKLMKSLEELLDDED